MASLKIFDEGFLGDYFCAFLSCCLEWAHSIDWLLVFRLLVRSRVY